MRHKVAGRKLNRTSAHRKSMLRNLAASLVAHEAINTTLPKAKELRRYVEPMITRARRGTLADQRYLASMLRSEELAKKMVRDLAERYRTRNGGYTRILKSGFRHGDNAPMAFIELVDRPMEKQQQG